MFDDFTYYYKNMSMKRFDDFDNAIKLMEKIEDRDMKVEEVKNEKHVFKLNLKEMKKQRVKSEERKIAVENVKMLYNMQKKVIKLSDDYLTIVFEAKYKTIHREGIKILTTKQMLQRLTTALAQVKAGNNLKMY